VPFVLPGVQFTAQRLASLGALPVSFPSEPRDEHGSDDTRGARRTHCQRAARRRTAAWRRAFRLASFWAFYGALTVATEVLEPHHGRRPLEALAAVNPRIFLNPVAGIMKFSCAAVCDYPSADRGTRRWSIGWV
jgi:hypothetical protein